MASEETKAIQIKPDTKLYDKITRAADRLRTSRGGFCELALEFILPKIATGELVVINGKIEERSETVSGGMR